MVSHMKTTLNIDDTVMQRLREEAARRGTTMSALAPLPTWRCGGLLVDIANREELYRVMEEGASPNPIGVA